MRTVVHAAPLWIFVYLILGCNPPEVVEKPSFEVSTAEIKGGVIEQGQTNVVGLVIQNGFNGGG